MIGDTAARRTAWVLVGIAISLGSLTLGFFLLSLLGASQRGIEPPWDVALAVPFTVVGALIALHQPRNLVAWSLLTGGISQFAGAFLTVYSQFGLLSRPALELPGPAVAAGLDKGVWAFFMAGVLFLVLLFPSGQLPSARWRPLAWFAVAGFPLVFVAIALVPGPLSAPLNDYTSPLGIGALAGYTVVIYLVITPLLVSVAAAVVNLVIRFHRSTGDERQQFKWLAFSASLLVLSLPVALVANFTGVANLVITVVLAALPVSVGIAVFKYRLWDIDVLINKTVVYGTLSVVLSVIYLTLVVLSQWLLRSITPKSDVAIVVSTLTVAALFQPIRRWIQARVDRRFYRRRYDAVQTVAAFSTRARNVVDFEALASELVAVVNQTLEPTHVSLWLRPSGEHEIGTRSLGESGRREVVRVRSGADKSQERLAEGRG